MKDHDLFVRSFFGIDPTELLKNTLSVSYPPYDVYKNEDTYVISLAVAGFKRDDLDVITENGQLIISGEKKKVDTPTSYEVIHQGIATRKFRLVFPLSSDMKVLEAEVANGLLTVTIQQTKVNTSKRLTIK